MPIVDGQRRIHPIGRVNGPRHKHPGGKTLVSTRVGNKDLSIKCNRKERTMAILTNVGLIKDFYGASASEALRIALHLTANAIRANRALPEVNND